MSKHHLNYFNCLTASMCQKEKNHEGHRATRCGVGQGSQRFCADQGAKGQR